MMKYELEQLNPLIFFQNNLLLSKQGLYGDLQVIDSGKHVKDVLLATYVPSKERISLLIAQEFFQEKEELRGKGVTIINSSPPSMKPGFDNLYIENLQNINSPDVLFSWFFKPHQYRPRDQYLRLSLLRIKIQKAYEAYRAAELANSPQDHLDRLRRQLSEPISDLFRRFSLAISTVSLSLLGLTFGITISRRHNSKGLIPVVAFGALTISCFLAAKKIEYNLLYSGTLYFMPIVLMSLISYITLKRLIKGYS